MKHIIAWLFNLPEDGFILSNGAYRRARRHALTGRIERPLTMWRIDTSRLTEIWYVVRDVNEITSFRRDLPA
jgi:hypothetical protein